MRSFQRAGFIQRGREKARARELVDSLDVRPRSITQHVRTMSGGNQQKVVLAKWLGTEPRLLIIDEPTRGIDVGTKSEVHRLISELAVSGVAVLMISSELPEVLGMADRVLVMNEGRIIARLDPSAEDLERALFRTVLADARERGPRPSERGPGV